MTPTHRLLSLEGLPFEEAMDYVDWSVKHPPDTTAPEAAPTAHTPRNSLVGGPPHLLGSVRVSGPGRVEVGSAS
jgi:hypothetical protein